MTKKKINEYESFIQSKKIENKYHGIEIKPKDVHSKLFDFQNDVVIWAARKGRAAVFLDTGLGKTFVQLEWARLLRQKTLIIAPLSVARQTVREAKKINIDVLYCRHQDEAVNQINITNYEMLGNFDAQFFGAVVLDESSILKALDGKTRQKLTDMFEHTKYRLACTATPAPNDLVEIGNHAEFLGIATINDMKAMFFVHANKETEIRVGNSVVRKKHSATQGQEWRLKHHAHSKFYQWLASWAISLRKPSDLGYDDDGYKLPSLNIQSVFVNVDYKPDDQLFFTGLHGIQDRNKVRHATMDDRIKVAASLVNKSDEQWLVWCGLNPEGDALVKKIKDASQIKGSDDIEHKIVETEKFQDGKTKALITKAKISGFGMNFQNAHNMVFVGLGDSWESYYQCIRRQYRFGQKKPVNVYIVLSDVEREIYDNVMNKERMAAQMSEELIKHVKDYEKMELENKSSDVHHDYKEDTVKGTEFTLMLGDSSQRLKEVESDSVDMSVYSPPFADLYTYSASEFDLGNSKDWSEFFKHYKFIIRELLRVTKEGRLTCVHTADIPAMSVRDGYIGMKDFPGAVIKAYESEGWVFVGRAIVGKNPQAQAIRTKAKALLFIQLKKDSSDSRPAILDQVLMFKKPGENKVPVKPVENGEMNNETWIDWAGGIWTGISESDTLQYTTARDKNDEKHVAPLQLGTIERCVKLYSNPGETVLTPFLGIGSEAYTAVKLGRKAIGIELKESYYKIAVKNLQNIESQVKQKDLFTWDK